MIHRQSGVLVSSAFLLFLAAFALSAPDAAGGSAPQRVVRVFRLSGVDQDGATQELRVQVGIAAVASLEARNVMVVADSAEQVARAEELLRRRDPRLRAADPHPPLDFAAARATAPVVRVLPVTPADIPDAQLLLRVLYGVRKVDAASPGNGLVVEASPAVLDASEALLSEVGLLPKGTVVSAP